MTSRQLAARMGVSQPAVIQLEQSEVAGRARLESLRKAAVALDCELVYALVPRTSIEDTLEARAYDLASRHLASADIEQIDPDTDVATTLERRIDRLAAALLAGGRLWDVRDAD